VRSGGSPGSGGRNFADRNFNPRSGLTQNNGSQRNATQRFEANRQNLGNNSRDFGSNNRGPSRGGSPGASMTPGRPGGNRSDFVARNFRDTNNGNFGRGLASPGNDFRRGDGDRGGPGDGNRGDGNRGDWNRDGNRGDWNRGDWARGDGNRGDWNGNNWNRNDWSRNDWNRGGWGNNNWGRNDWNRHGWNQWGNNNWNRGWNNGWNTGWNNNWNNGWNNGWNNNWWGGNRGWWGYGRNIWWTPGWNSWGWGWGWPLIGWNNWGLGWGWGLGNVGWTSTSYPTYYDTTNVYPTTTLYADTAVADVQQPVAQQPALDPLATTGDFVADGEAAFRAGRYQDALRLWQHSMVDDPDNGAVVLLMGQAMFALGQYEAAANATQMGMQMLPESEWGNVVKNYTQLYGNIEDYTNQVRAAEKARDARADDGAVRFVLGYHFGFLNYPKQAVRELDAALAIEPRDVGAEKLRDMFAVQAGIPARPHTAQPADGQPGALQPGVGAPAGAPPVPGLRLGPDQKPATPPAPVGTDA